MCVGVGGGAGGRTGSKSSPRTALWCSVIFSDFLVLVIIKPIPGFWKSK